MKDQNSIVRFIVLALLFASDLCASAEPTPEAIQARADIEIQQTQNSFPSYTVLISQQKTVLPAWRELLRQQLVISSERPEILSQAIALNLAYSYKKYYINRADDATVNALIQQQRILYQRAISDSNLCGILLNTPSARADQYGKAPWLSQKNYVKLMPELQGAVSLLIENSQGRQERSLPVEQTQVFIQRVFLQMSETYGEQSQANLLAIENEHASAEQRCLGLHQLLETIHRQELPLRAQLVRIYFGE